MKNVIKNGMINIDGKFGSEAFESSPSEHDFYDNIEGSVKPLVRWFVENEYYTKSSCQGHTINDEISQIPNILFLTKVYTEELLWETIVKRYCRKNDYTNDFIYVKIIDPATQDEVRDTNYLSIVFDIEKADNQREFIDALILDFTNYIDNYFKIKNNKTRK